MSFSFDCFCIAGVHIASLLVSIVLNAANAEGLDLVLHYPSCIKKGGNLDTNGRNPKSLDVFKKMIESEEKKSIFSLYDPFGPTSYLNKYKFTHCFNNAVNPIWACC